MFANLLRVSTASRVFVLCAVIFSQRFLPTEFSSPFFVLLSLLIIPFGKIQRSYFKLVLPLLGVFVLGFMGVSDHESRNILRDIAYALTPISLIFIGYWMAGNRGMRSLILRVMVTCSFILAAVHLSAFVQKTALFSAHIAYIRGPEGAGVGAGTLVVLSLVLGLFQYRLGIGNLFPKFLPSFIVMPVLLASIVLSYSRTEFLVTLILLVALSGILTKVNLRSILAITVLVVSFSAIALTTPKDEVGTFRGKLARSFTEIVVSDYQDMSDIHLNWRGYETYRALSSFSSGNVLPQIFGQGFGALVDLGFYMPLGGEDFRYIPVLHSGYAYILIKAGLLGLVCYVFFYISVIRIAMRYTNASNSEQRFLAQLLLGSVLSLVLTMFVVGGMAEMHNSEFVLLLGYLVRRIGQYQVEESRIEVVRIG